MAKTEIMTNIPDVQTTSFQWREWPHKYTWGITLHWALRTKHLGKVKRQIEQAWAAFSAYKQTLCSWIPLISKLRSSSRCWMDDVRGHGGRDWMSRAQDRQEWKKLEEAYVQNWIKKVQNWIKRKGRFDDDEVYFVYISTRSIIFYYYSILLLLSNQL